MDNYPNQNCTICSDSSISFNSLDDHLSTQKICLTNFCQLFNVELESSSEVHIEILLGQNPNYKFCHGCYTELSQVDRLYKALNVLLEKLTQIKVGFEKKILTCHLKGASCKNAIIDQIIREIRPGPVGTENAAAAHIPVTDPDLYLHLKDNNREIEQGAETGSTIGHLSDLEERDNNKCVTLSRIAQDIIVKKSTCKLVNNEVNNDNGGFANDEDLNEGDGQENEEISTQILSLRKKKEMDSISISSENENDNEIEIIEDDDDNKDEEWQPEEPKRRRSAANQVLNENQIKKMKTECTNNQAKLILNRLPLLPATVSTFTNEEKVKKIIELEKCQMEKIANLKKNRYKCPVCGLKLINDSNFQEHISKHPVCNLCQPVRRFYLLRLLQHHQKFMHTESPPKITLVDGVEFYICTLCNKELKSFTGYVKHYQNTHKKDEIFTCPVFRCGKHFYLNSELLNHMNRKHPDLQEGRKHLCTKCGQKYTRESYLKNHKCLTNDRYKCQYCGKGFSSSYKCRTHEKGKHLPHEHMCEICSSTFGTISELRTHIKFKHNTTKAEKDQDKKMCSFCGQLVSKNFLESHISQIHTKEFHYFCQHCSKGFYKMSLLTHHLKRTHPTENQIWTCNFKDCSNKTFTSEASYYNHRRKHRPAKYICVECDKHYFRKLNYDEHMIHHHNRASIIPISCDNCSRSFSLKRYFQNHRRKCIAQVKDL